MFLDSNADTLNNAFDRLDATAQTEVVLWLDTNHDRDGSAVTCIDEMTISSYEFILHAVGGTLTWHSFTNHLSTATVSFAEAGDTTDYYNGRGGSIPLGPGKFKLATVVVSIRSGSPRLEIVEATPLSAAFTTSFGSKCPGLDGDNTLKLGTDWKDVDGLSAPGLQPVVVVPKTWESPKDSSVSVAIEALDPAGSTPPSISVSGQPPSLSLSVSQTDQNSATGILSGTPSGSEVDEYTIIWTVTGVGGTIQDTTHLVFTEINFRPVVFAPASENGQEGNTISFTVGAYDEEGDPITSFTANMSQLPSGHNATFVTNATKTQGVFTWTPDFNDAGTYSVVFTATNNGSGSDNTVINVVNGSPARFVRLQLPAPGYRVIVKYFWCPTDGLCKEETLVAGDSGQVYVPVNIDAANGNFAVWDRIRVEFPARTYSAWFSVPETQEDPLAFVASNPQFIGHPVEWDPPVAMPPYNYAFVPTAASSSFIRLLTITNQIYNFWADTYGVIVSPEEIRLWEDLDGPDFIHDDSPFINFNYIRWPWDLDRFYTGSDINEARILAHEFTHVMQYRAIYTLDDFPSGSGDHTLCSDDNAEQSWKEGMANGISEYFLVRVRGQRYGTNANAGDGPGYEQRTVFWTCPSYTLATESTSAFYVYLMNRQSPREFMDCLRYATFDRVALGERHAQSLIDFSDLWNDRNPWGSGIVVHRRGSWNDEGVLRYVQGITTGVEGPRVSSADEFGAIRRVYPSPARDVISVEAIGPTTGAARIRIVQPSGRVVREMRVAGLVQGVYQIIQLDVSNLASGVYFVVYSDSSDRGIRSGRRIVILK